jgi:hypothetical protein
MNRGVEDGKRESPQPRERERGSGPGEAIGPHDLGLPFTSGALEAVTGARPYRHARTHAREENENQEDSRKGSPTVRPSVCVYVGACAYLAFPQFCAASRRRPPTEAVANFKRLGDPGPSRGPRAVRRGLSRIITVPCPQEGPTRASRGPRDMSAAAASARRAANARAHKVEGSANTRTAASLPSRTDGRNKARFADACG